MTQVRELSRRLGLLVVLILGIIATGSASIHPF
jgi:hypothetical protein